MANGWWAIAETGQGGGLPDTLHGPYWDENKTKEIAQRMTADSRQRGRVDHFDVVELVLSDEP